MRYSIKQLDDETWELRDGTGLAVGTFTSKNGQRGYDLALAELATLISNDPRRLATGDGGEEPNDGDDNGDGLLTEGWVSPALALSELLPGGRDFTETKWSWRDPATSLVPLMFQSKNAGHYDADLVGFFTELAMDGTTVTARGRFYDTDIAEEARDVLLGERPFGVSVDPTEKVEAEYEEVCTSWDDDGFCMEADLNMKFLSYEIGGATMHPFQGFDKAQVLLDPAPTTASAQPVKASATTLSIPTAPPLEWMTLAEPKPGTAFVDELSGDDVLVEQIDPRTGRVLGMACPLTIRDDGLVYGHLTYWGQCHTANPWGAGLCASAEPSADGYATFHSSGSVKCADGTDVATGRLVVGCEHSDAMTPELVRDHLARAGMGWANVRVTDGEFGPWVSGVLDASLTPTQVATLRALSMSGEWVGELGGILSVNASGLPIQRAKIAASAFGRGPAFVIPNQAVRASMSGGKITKLVGSNVIAHCSECARRAALRSSARGEQGEVLTLLRELGDQVQRIDDRTAHLRGDAALAAQRSLAASARS